MFRLINTESFKPDINECNASDICPDHSSCTNTIGSHRCECNEGFYGINIAECYQYSSTHQVFQLCLDSCSGQFLKDNCFIEMRKPL